MNEKYQVTRRRFLQGATGVAGLLAVMPDAFGGDVRVPAVAAAGGSANLYADLLKSWCDAMVGLQVFQPNDPAQNGLIRCPGCAHIHGRCADALYPLMHMARITGDVKYMDAAVNVQLWSDNVTQADGSWLNEVSGSTWKGITVFGAIALADALHYHGELLDAKVRARWTDRLARAVKFLDGFMNMDKGNINYPVTSSLAFATAGRVLDNKHYTDRGHEFAHGSMEFFTKNNFLFGEGKPQKMVTPKGARPIDMGYNVEESLPALALYGLMMDDREVIERTVAALRTHMEFMLPDGGWDNSWGSRNYKWTWWGSRTSDGCQPAYAMLAKHDPCFREIAWRNLEQLSACTHDGLLYGGPHYHSHGEKPCVHHTFAHAKALASVLDHGEGTKPDARVEIPREKVYGLKSYSESGVSLVSVGRWRATVTEYDWEYTIGGQASGGTLSLLYHMGLGPVLSASMTEYRMVEEHNQQKHGDYPTMCLTPRVELREGEYVYTSLSDLKADVKTSQDGDVIIIKAGGRLESVKHELPRAGEIKYRFVYSFAPGSVKISAVVSGAVDGVKLIVPVIAAADEHTRKVDGQTICIKKPGGLLEVRTSAVDGFEKMPARERVFNLVPGFACKPLILGMPADGKEVSVEFSEG